MPINLDALGVVRSIQHDIPARWVLAYAACLGVVDPICLDDSQPGGPCVVPTFCSCLEWAVTIASRNSLLGLTDSERASGVHASQSSEFFAPVQVGMKVRTTAQVVGMRRTSAGALVQSCFEMVDTRSDTLLTRSFAGTIFRGMDLGVDAIGQPSARPVPQRTAFTKRSVVPIDRGLPHVYSECARIWNPIHTEQVVARAAGLPGIILHGSATWALAGREVIASCASGDMRCLAGLSGSFKKPVTPGEHIVVEMSDPQDAVVAFVVRTGKGETAIADGVAVLRGPRFA